jgi:chaperonin cofactor prefoldin
MILTVIIQSILFAIGLFKIYTDMQVKLSELEIRLKSVEKQDDEIYSKLDKIMDKLTAMQINIENKQNRG